MRVGKIDLHAGALCKDFVAMHSEITMHIKSTGNQRDMALLIRFTGQSMLISKQPLPEPAKLSKLAWQLR